MKRALIELFDNNKDLVTNLKGIRKLAKIPKEIKDEEIVSILKELELEGIVYINKEELYTHFPSNFFVCELLQNKKGNLYIEYDDTKVIIDPDKANGALAFDNVIIGCKKEGFYVDKVIKRNFPQVVCDVVLIDNVKYLKPLTKQSIRIDIGSIAMKKLVEGERVLVNLTEDLFDDRYIGTLEKVLGHKDDPDIDFKTIAYNYGFNLEFSEEAKKELESIPDEVREIDIDGRVDFRKWTTFTIDGIDTKDIDDAVSIKKLKDNSYLLGVHIAHVSHYIKRDSTLFNEALERSTSVYFPNYVIPMFPHKISNGICSLNEDVDRLARTTLIRFDENGNVIDYKILRTVIHSNKKMNYDDVNRILVDNIIPIGYKPYVEDLKIMQELSNKLTELKKERGFIDFGDEEIKFDINENNVTDNITVHNRDLAEKLIENFMVKANELVAGCVGTLPFIYRNHEMPDEHSIKQTVNKLKELGYHFQKLNEIQNSKTLQGIIKELEKKDEFCVLSPLLLKSLKRAYYGNENMGHYGLALDFYTHSTSPIRRVVDLLVQYTLDYYEANEFKSDKDLVELNAFLDEMSIYASKKERLADNAEYEGDQLRYVEYAKQMIGQEYEAFIDNITKNNITIKSSFLLDGIITYDDILNDNVKFIEGKNAPLLKSNIDGKKYKIGHKLKVRIKSADYTTKTVKYELIENITEKEKQLQKKIKRH